MSFADISIGDSSDGKTGSGICGPGTKRSGNGSCVELVSADLYRALNWHVNPPETKCSDLVTIDGLSVCKDNFHVGLMRNALCGV